MPVDKDDFRRALGTFAAAVAVVTSKFENGERAGITVTAFSSLSLTPPQVLICIGKQARIHDRLQVGGNYAVNVLSQDQEAVSQRFASSKTDPFLETPFIEGAIGAPLLEGSIASIECRIVELLPGGDHTIVVGQVEATHVSEGMPLMYYRGRYSHLV